MDNGVLFNGLRRGEREVRIARASERVCGGQQPSQSTLNDSALRLKRGKPPHRAKRYLNTKYSQIKLIFELPSSLEGTLDSSKRQLLRLFYHPRTPIHPPTCPRDLPTSRCAPTSRSPRDGALPNERAPRRV